MRTIERTSQFKKDYKRELRGRYQKTLESDFLKVLSLLIADKPLPDKYRDHALTGNLKGFRDCHIRPDLVLIYGKPDTESLQLVRLGSHSELGI